MSHESSPCRPHSTSGITLRLALAGLVLLVGTATTGLAGERNLNPAVLPTQSSAYGKTYGEWSGAFWRWVFSQPLAGHPLLDETGEDAANGQSGKVWFLAGTFGGGATREVIVPVGKALFIAVLTTCYVNVPELGDPEWSPEQWKTVSAINASFIDGAEVSCKIDGVEVANLAGYRQRTPLGNEYMCTMPEGNLFDSFGLPAGTYGPAIDDGIYLLLAPLSRGKHTIRFSGSSGNFTSAVTYNITVK